MQRSDALSLKKKNTNYRAGKGQQERKAYDPGWG